MSKIYLNPVIASGLGEDTFWTWFERVFPEAEFGVPETIGEKDVVLHYSTKGAALHPRQSICLLWELYPEMKVRMQTSRWDKQMALIDVGAKTSARLTISSELMRPFYAKYDKPLDLLPIAVNAELFRPMDNVASLREKYEIPNNKLVAFWGGNTHAFKGPHLLEPWMKENPDVHVIAAWTYKRHSRQLPGASNFVCVPQETLAELMNCADFFLATSLLRPYYMVEWEAMACNLPFVFANDLEVEFEPGSNPREQVLKRKWDRDSAREVWADYIEAFRETL
jgi:glycosyltransferase involved in cell wall biosynthesis